MRARQQLLTRHRTPSPPPPLCAQTTQGVGFINPPRPGLRAQSSQPQAPGSMLTVADISPALKGRHAELYWPADSSWYLIEIQVRLSSWGLPRADARPKAARGGSSKLTVAAAS